MSTPNYRDNRTHRAARRCLTGLFVLMVLMTSIAASASARTVRPADNELINVPSIWLDGPSQAKPGEDISYNITTDVSGLFGAQFEISFDPAVLQVIGTQVTPGSCPKPDFVAENSVDNTAGTIAYAAAALNPTPPCDGGIVASFQFQVSPAAAVGSTQVKFDEVLLANIDASEIPVTAVDLNLEILDTTTVAEFSATPLFGPAALAVDFQNLSTQYDTCAWEFGDGGTSTDCSDPSHTYSTKGIYTVSLTVNKSGGGSDTEIKSGYITVTDPVSAEFSGTPTAGPAPLTVNLTNLSSGDYDTCTWDFGDDSSSSLCQNQSHVYSAAGAYTVKLTVSGPGGSDTEIKTGYITVTGPVTAEFSGTPTKGPAPLAMNFTNLSSGDYSACTWNYGDGDDGSSCQNHGHVYIAPGSYTVKLTVSGPGGSDSETKVDYIVVWQHYWLSLPIILR